MLATYYHTKPRKYYTGADRITAARVVPDLPEHGAEPSEQYRPRTDCYPLKSVTTSVPPPPHSRMALLMRPTTPHRFRGFLLFA